MKIAICEDEKYFRDGLAEQVKSYFTNYPLASLDLYEDAESLLRAYEGGARYDTLFMDIELPGISGTAAAAQIRDIDIRHAIVFITNYAGYTLAAIEAEPVGYLSKPVTDDDLYAMLDKCVRKYKVLNGRVIWPGETGPVSIRIRDIVYLQSYDKKVKAHLIDGQYIIVDKKLKDIEQELKMWLFERCHKSYIINLFYVQNINQNIILTKTGATLPLSWRLTKKVKQALNLADFGEGVVA